MQQVSLLLTPFENWESEPLRTIQQSECINELVVYAQNHLGDDSVLLCQVNGSNDFEKQLTSLTCIKSVDVEELAREKFFARLEINLAGSLGKRIFSLLFNEIVIVLPIIIREADIRYRIVGSEEAISNAIDMHPPELNLEILQVVSKPTHKYDISYLLTKSQEEVFKVALREGYYKYPKETTHEDIAEIVGCSTSNVSVHLQKAEAQIFNELYSREVWI